MNSDDETRSYLNSIKQSLSHRDKIEKFIEAFAMNQDFFTGKVVLNVGCGSGLLSMLAAKTRAAVVIGVDTHNSMDVTKQVVEENNMSEQVHIIDSKIEDLSLPNGLEKVDVIISDCFGESLLHKSHLESVIVARDRFLRPGGLMFPDTASLYMLGNHTGQDSSLSDWDCQHGFNMTAMAEKEKQEAQLQRLELKQVMTNKCLLKEVNMATVKREDLQFTVPFQLYINKKGYIHSVALHYSIKFTSGIKMIEFNTGFQAPNKDSRQSVLFLREFLVCNVGDLMSGVFNMDHSVHRLIIKLNVKLTGKVDQAIHTMEFVFK